jgi:hypothetical protein
MLIQVLHHTWLLITIQCLIVSLAVTEEDARKAAAKDKAARKVTKQQKHQKQENIGMFPFSPLLVSIDML